MYEAREKKKRKAESIAPAVGKATLSGAVSGGLLGGVERLLSGARKADILRGALGAAGIYGGISGSSQALGSEMLGAPTQDDPHAMTTRGLVGGLTEGGLAGAGLGALAAAGHMSAPTKLLGEYYRNLAKAGRLKDLLHGAALGAGAGASAGGYIGRSEGMESDAWRNQRHRGEP